MPESENGLVVQRFTTPDSLSGNRGSIPREITSGFLAQWQSSGLLNREVRVRVPGNPPMLENTVKHGAEHTVPHSILEANGSVARGREQLSRKQSDWVRFPAEPPCGCRSTRTPEFHSGNAGENPVRPLQMQSSFSRRTPDCHSGNGGAIPPGCTRSSGFPRAERFGIPTGRGTTSRAWLVRVQIAPEAPMSS